jgi:hypothetical protein
MNIIEAIKAAGEGKRIRNSEWPSWRKFIYPGMVSEEFYWINDKDIRALYHLNYIDLISDTWEVYEEEPKLYNFEEAFKALGNGKTISRTRKKSGLSIYMNRAKSPDELIMFNYDDIKATDWRIIGE